jgi:hypothetical protein
MAAASSPVRVSFLGQSHTARPGSAWAFYVQVRQSNHPWQGVARVDVQTPKGKIVDDVGRYPVRGSLLLGYLWNPKDHGLFIFRVVLMQNGRSVGQVAYPVRVT